MTTNRALVEKLLINNQISSLKATATDKHASQADRVRAIGLLEQLGQNWQLSQGE